MSRQWRNPYSTESVQHTVAQLNYERVQRAKREEKFLENIREHYTLTDYEEFEESELHVVEPPDGSRSKPKKRKKVKKKAVKANIRPLGEFAAVVRTLVVTQGGATLWTSENDGYLCVRSGESGGRCVHTFPRAAPVESLHATDTHVWAGCRDGTLRIYDHLVYVMVAEARVHSASITCFAALADRVWTGSVDQTVVKWRDENRMFNMLLRSVATHTGAIRCMVATTVSVGPLLPASGRSTGAVLITGCDDTIIRCLDAESLDRLSVFEGHEGPVTCVAVADRLLLSGSEDTTVRVWDIPTVLCLRVLAGHRATVSGIVPDVVSNQFWSSDLAGRVRIWDMREKTNFRIRHKIKDTSVQCITMMHTFRVVDAIKVWTTGADGGNVLHHASTDREVDAMTSTRDAMEGVIARDSIELERWRQRVENKEEREYARKLKIQGRLTDSTNELFLRRYYEKWLRSPCQRNMRDPTKRGQLVRLLSANRQRLGRRVVFARMLYHFKWSVGRKTKRALADALQGCTERRVLWHYYSQLQSYVDRRDDLGRRRAGAVLLANSAHRVLLSAYWRKWSVFGYVRDLRRKRDQIGATVGAVNPCSILRTYWVHWVNFRRHAARRKRNHQCAWVLLCTTNRWLARRYVTQWRDWYHDRRWMIQRRVVVGSMERQCAHQLIASYYRKWRTYHRMREVDQLEASLHVEMATYHTLRTQSDSIEEYANLKRKLDTALERVRNATRHVAYLTRRHEQLSISHEDLQRQLEDIPPRERTEVYYREMATEVMGVLKCEILNFNTDFKLIQELRDKCRVIPISRVFWEAHANLSRVVLSVTGDGKPGSQWQLSPNSVNRLPPHQLGVCLQSAKHMVVAWDMMDPATRELEVDEEVATNGSALVQICAVALHHRRQVMKPHATPHRKAPIVNDTAATPPED